MATVTRTCMKRHHQKRPALHAEPNTAASDVHTVGIGSRLGLVFVFRVSCHRMTLPLRNILVSALAKSIRRRDLSLRLQSDGTNRCFARLRRYSPSPKRATVSSRIRSIAYPYLIGTDLGERDTGYESTRKALHKTCFRPDLSKFCKISYRTLRKGLLPHTRVCLSIGCAN